MLGTVANPCLAERFELFQVGRCAVRGLRGISLLRQLDCQVEVSVPLVMCKSGSTMGQMALVCPSKKATPRIVEPLPSTAVAGRSQPEAHLRLDGLTQV